MNTFFTLWKNAVLSSGYRSLNAFIEEHDPSGSAYQTTTKKLTGMPGPDRIKRWAKILKLSDVQRDELLAAADRDRVLVAKDGKQLGTGIKALNAEVTSLRIKNAEVVKERDCLKSERDLLKQVIAQVKQELIRLKMPVPNIFDQVGK